MRALDDYERRLLADLVKARPITKAGDRFDFVAPDPFIELLAEACDGAPVVQADIEAGASVVTLRVVVTHDFPGRKLRPAEDLRCFRGRDEPARSAMLGGCGRERRENEP